jgi:signal transduction histidine kinase
VSLVTVELPRATGGVFTRVAYRKTKPVFIWIAAIPLIFLAASLWMRARDRELVQMVDHTREIQVTIQDLLTTLTDAETGRRGFIATGDSSYIAQVEGAAARSSVIVRRLADLTRDNPVEHLKVPVLERLVNDRIGLLKETSKFGGQDAAVQEEKRNGLATSSQLSRVLADMVAEENRLLDSSKQATSVADFEAGALLIAGSIATILLLLLAYRIVSQYAADRDRAESEVRKANQKLQEKIGQLDRLNHDLEERVKERTSGLERSNHDLQQFAFVASHDLQEPLRMVSSYLGLLSKACQGKLDPEAEKYVGFAMDGATRMQALIRDLLAYAQISTQAPALTRTRLAEVVSQARYALLASIRETGAEIAIEPLPEVEVDPLKMSLVFQNLLSNAIKFRQPGGKPSIRIEARKDDNEWCISVRDQGIGFDPKYAKKIFGAFQRLHGKDAYPGTGIGLAICSRIIDGHGGRIWAEADPGAGAVFHFTLPALTDPLGPEKESGNAAAFSTGQGSSGRAI